MQIEIRGINVEVTEELRAHADKRFARIGRQVPDAATLVLELSEEQNPSIRDSQVAEAHLHLKGVTLSARERSPDMLRSIKELSKDLGRQVKRYRERRRNRAVSRRFAARLRGREA